MPFDEDISLFFGDTGFTSTAIVDGKPVNGVFLDEGTDIGGVITEAPEFHGDSAALKNAVRGSVVVIDNINYKSLAPIADGTGITILPLEVQQ